MSEDVISVKVSDSTSKTADEDAVEDPCNEQGLPKKLTSDGGAVSQEGPRYSDNMKCYWLIDFRGNYVSGIF